MEQEVSAVDVAKEDIRILLVDDDEIARRRERWSPIQPRYTTGILGKYARLAQGAEKGAITNPV